jgi:hypothetical protein
VKRKKEEDFLYEMDEADGLFRDPFSISLFITKSYKRFIRA